MRALSFSERGSVCIHQAVLLACVGLMCVTTLIAMGDGLNNSLENAAGAFGVAGGRSSTTMGQTETYGSEGMTVVEAEPECQGAGPSCDTGSGQGGNAPVVVGNF